MTAPVYIDPALSDRAHGTYRLEGDEGFHAATVRRARPGERIDVVNGKGLRARCEVHDADKRGIDLLVLSVEQEAETEPKIVLVQALAKGGRDEQAVETATEYGVSTIVPWQSDRAIASWRGKERKGRARWEATAWAATKQSRRSWLPQVDDVVGTTQLVEEVARMTRHHYRVFVCHEEAQLRLIDALVGEGYEARGYGVVVGPEGGISPREVTALCAVGGEPVLLSEYVLRSASAGPYAIATINAGNILGTND
ncbi:MAG: 16S rRNA (uracil(1498)-N(3))-methyltransferase [Ancrocorticia sp.]|jgi:16S rRNA (uracil1498-N3)-methyltransferase|nr:16S rRNA (uracil(1498)-N(3))-methyltransferase [Ancrocorticia sp.]MCI2002703.1 16S rRNA (uracil(1498)-N(3))-methyltransferase [Ancrocorticia sp.]